MVFDTLIKGGLVVTPVELKSATVAIEGGKIAAILSPNGRATGLQTIDASGLYLLPGLIDTHVHLRDPARPDRETFETGTAAAAAGGVTTICEMPTSDPPVNTAFRLRDRAAALAPKAYVDYCLYGGAGPENIQEIDGMASAGAVAFKTWLHSPAPGRESEFIGLCCPSLERLPSVMAAVAKTRRIHALHCENDEVLARALISATELEGPPGLKHAVSRPLEAEDQAVRDALAIAKTTGTRIQIVHVSSPAAVRQIVEARREGVRVTIETCPHYLVLTENTLIKYGSFAKCNPPLRNASTVDELWQCVADGNIDVIGTDHCPYLPEELEAGNSDIFASPPGIPGLETMLPVLLTAVAKNCLTLSQLVNLTSTRASQLFGLKGKGRIEAGADADITIVDLKEEWVFDGAKTFSKASRNAKFFDGTRFTGRVAETWIRGHRTYVRGSVEGSPGRGRFVRPQ